MFCVHCGSERPDNASFCPACGKPVVSGLVTSPAPISTATVVAAETAFFNVGTLKLALMCVSTFNTYALYWLYKNWVAERERSRESIVPWARAFFAVLFIYSLARRVYERVLELGLAPHTQPGALAVLFIGLCMSGNLPDPFWLLSMFAGLALVPLQTEMARVNAAEGNPVGPEARFSVVNIVWLTIAALLWLLMLIGLFLPEP